MINAGKARVKELKDGWTVVTADRSLTAQWEHMVVVTEDGVENLSAFVPSTTVEIERAMAEAGLVQFRPATPLPVLDPHDSP